MASASRLIACLAVASSAPHAALAQAYLGLGVSRLSLTSEYSSIDGRHGTGFTLVGGYGFASTWLAELAVSAAHIDAGPTQGISYPADKAEYSILRLTIGKNLWPLAEHAWAPWVSAGTAYHYINWDTFYYQLEGSGLSLGAGVDFEPTRLLRLRLQALWHRFPARDTYDEGPFSTRARELSAVLFYIFR